MSLENSKIIQKVSKVSSNTTNNFIKNENVNFLEKTFNDIIEQL